MSQLKNAGFRDGSGLVIAIVPKNETTGADDTATILAAGETSTTSATAAAAKDGRRDGAKGGAAAAAPSALSITHGVALLSLLVVRYVF